MSLPMLESSLAYSCYGVLHAGFVVWTHFINFCISSMIEKLVMTIFVISNC